MEDRDYQIEAVDAAFKFFAEHPFPEAEYKAWVAAGSKEDKMPVIPMPVIALPTGTGKSHVISRFARVTICNWPGQRIVMATHVKELIEQNFAKLLQGWPSAPAGIYSAGLDRKEIRDITYAGIASIWKVAQAFGHVDILLVDECHLVSDKDTTMYRAFLAALRRVNPRVRVVGLTATPWRLGMGELTDGNLFTHLCYNKVTKDEFVWFIDQGYLVPLVPKRTDHELDVSGVPIVAGEFAAGKLQDAVNKTVVTYYALKETVEKASSRGSWLVFTTGIQHTEDVAKMLNEEFGISALPVHSKITPEARADAIAKFKSGEVRALVNPNILTTGFDHPGIDCIVVLRPTNSPVLWVQMLGRGTRPVYPKGMPLSTLDERLGAIAASSKQDCLVLDFAANSRRLGPINDPKVPKRRGAGTGGQAIIKICESCGTYNHPSVRYCTHCGYEFPQAVGFGREASEAPIIVRSTEKAAPEVGIFKIDHMTYTLNKSRDISVKPDSMRVNYRCGLREFSEWICFDHDNFAKHKAHEWWRHRVAAGTPLHVYDAKGKLCVPPTVSTALQYAHLLRVPTHIRVWVNKKYPEILNHDFTGTAFGGANDTNTSASNSGVQEAA